MATASESIVSHNEFQKTLAEYLGPRFPTFTKIRKLIMEMDAGCSQQTYSVHILGVLFEE